MSEKERNGLGTSHESEGNTPPDILEIQKSLEKIGLTVTEDVLRRIGEKAETKKAFETDIKALLSQNPPNPTEIQRLETIWIKGYGQVVTIGGKEYTFAYIATRPVAEQDELKSQMAPKDKLFYNRWRSQVANQQNEQKREMLVASNQEADKIAEQRQVANQNIELVNRTREQINAALAKPAEVFRKLPGDLESKARESALQNPPKELQGASTEAIQSGKYDNLILASYAVNNATTIANGLSEDDKKLFASAVIEAEDILGGDGRAKFRELTSSLVLGEDRAKIESAGNNLIDRGYNREVVWDPQARRFTFENALGEKRIIETARIPPQETIENGILSLSNDIQIPPEKPETTERKKTERNIASTIDEASKGPFVGALPSSIQSEVQEGLKEAQTQPSSLEKITQAIRLLTLKANEIQKLIDRETPGSAEEKILKENLGTVMKQITTLNTLAGQYIKQKNDEKETRRDELDPFQRGKENLTGLSQAGLGDMLDMNEVVAFLQTQNGPHFANNFNDRNSINTYLREVSLSTEQKRELFQSMVTLYIHMSGDTTIQQKNRDEQYKILRTPTENGKTRLQNALQRERTLRDGRMLRKEDFVTILSREEKK